MSPLISFAGPALVEVTAAEVKYDEKAESDYTENSAFRLEGRGTEGKVLDRAGNVVYVNEKTGIYSAEVSPDETKIRIYFGDSNNLIWDPTARTSRKLPENTGNKNQLGLQDWHWISNDILLATSGVLDTHHQIKKHDHNQGPEILTTKLYLYSLKSGKLSELEPTPRLRSKNTFFVDLVSRTGYLKIAELNLKKLEAGEGVEVKTVGWFKIQ